MQTYVWKKMHKYLISVICMEIDATTLYVMKTFPLALAGHHQKLYSVCGLGRLLSELEVALNSLHCACNGELLHQMQMQIWFSSKLHVDMIMRIKFLGFASQFYFMIYFTIRDQLCTQANRLGTYTKLSLYYGYVFKHCEIGNVCFAVYRNRKNLSTLLTSLL